MWGTGLKGQKRVQIFYLKTIVMEMTGRLTADAVVRTVLEDTKVVGFTVAVNDSYKSGEERREIASYFECSYWRNAGIAEYLKKGDVVQVFGRMGCRAYVTKDAEAAAALTFRVSEIKLFGGFSHKGAISGVAVGAASAGVATFEWRHL